MRRPAILLTLCALLLTACGGKEARDGGRASTERPALTHGTVPSATSTVPGVTVSVPTTTTLPTATTGARVQRPRRIHIKPVTVPKTVTGGKLPPTGASPQVRAALEQCRQKVGQTSGLGTKVRDQLLELCSLAAGGDADALSKGKIELCRAIVDSTTVGGDEKSRKAAALKACEQQAAAG